MAKGKLFLAFSLILVVVSLAGVNAEFSYNEKYSNPTKNYDIWTYDVDIDDEDYRLTLKHVWSSPKYDSNYETKSTSKFDVTPPTPRLNINLLALNQPPRNSNDLGRSLVRSQGGYYGYSRNYFGGYYSGYYGGYIRNSWW